MAENGNRDREKSKEYITAEEKEERKMQIFYKIVLWVCCFSFRPLLCSSTRINEQRDKYSTLVK